MLTKDEIDFTISQMTNNAIFLIEECEEYECAIDILKQLKDVVKGNKEKAEEYWRYTLCGVIHDIPTYLSFFKGEELNYINSIIETLYNSK